MYIGLSGILPLSIQWEALKYFKKMETLLDVLFNKIFPTPMQRTDQMGAKGDEVQKIIQCCR